MTGKETCEKKGLNFFEHEIYEYGEMERCEEIGEMTYKQRNGLE
jgi:hypothetical protein